MSRQRATAGRMFFITVTFDYEVTVADKFILLSNMHLSDNPTVSYCLSCEKCDKSEKAISHIHCFIEFTHPIFILEICTYLREVYFNCRLDIQPCRSKKSCLKYVSKDDVNLLTNVKTSSLHFNCQCHIWASNTIKFDCTDPFVVPHRFQYKFLERYLIDFRKKNLKYFAGLKKYECVCYDTWMYDCVLWYNVLYQLDRGLKIFKRRQLFIHGPTNVGKSSLVERLIGKVNMKYVYYPGVGKFFMQSIDPFFHKFIVFE